MDPLTTVLSNEFDVDADTIQDANRQRASFDVVHLATMFKTNVFIGPGDARSREEMWRARTEELDTPDGKVAIRFAGPEDTPLHKLVWYERAVGSRTGSGATSLG